MSVVGLIVLLFVVFLCSGFRSPLNPLLCSITVLCCMNFTVMFHRCVEDSYVDRTYICSLVLNQNWGARLNCFQATGSFPSDHSKIERKAMIRNRYNYPTPPIRDIKGKETQTRNNWTLMETSLAESQTDSYFPTKLPNGYTKQKDVSDTHIQRRTKTKNKP